MLRIMVSCFFTLWTSSSAVLLCINIPSALGNPPVLKFVKLTPHPPVLLQGEDLRLTCTYDLALKDLYVVKWYREGHEFFRYAPKQRPVKKEFQQVPEVKVKVRDCDHHNVVLKNASYKTSGFYKCTVTAEVTFETVSAETQVTVVWIPTPAPKPNLTVSEVTGPGPALNDSKNDFIAQCVAPPSNPAANISWLVGGQKINEMKKVQIKKIKTTAIVDEQDDLITSHSMVEFSFPPKRSRNSTAILTCHVSVFEVYVQNASVQLNVTSGFGTLSEDLVDDRHGVSTSCGFRISGFCDSRMHWINIILISKWIVYNYAYMSSF